MSLRYRRGRVVRLVKAFVVVTLCGLCCVYLLTETFAVDGWNTNDDTDGSNESASIYWLDLEFPPRANQTYVVNSTYCQIALEDPLPTEWIDWLFSWSQKPRCPHSERRAVFETVVQDGRVCIEVRPDVLQSDYGLSPDKIRCELFDVVDGQPPATSLKLGTGRPLTATFSCPSGEAVWIGCAMPHNDTAALYWQPLMLATVRGQPKVAPSGNAFHVLLLQVDSVSRLAFDRTMPRTRRTLDRLFDDGDSPLMIPLYGYNMIGDSPLTRQISLLTGESASAAEAYAADPRVARKRNISFIWDDFRDNGYRTMLVEEHPDLVDELKKLAPSRVSFADPPTDYALTDLFATIRTSANDGQWCAFGQPTTKMLLDFVHDTMQVLTRCRPLFAYVRLNQLTQTHLAGGQLLDDVMASFFDALATTGVLEQTIVFFVSDHGNRTSEFAHSAQGRLEELLPFAFALLPDEFRRNSGTSALAARLAANSRRLLSPMDVFATLSEIATGGVTKRPRKYLYAGSGVSLVSNVVPAERTCAVAGIPDAFCSCFRFYELNDTLLGARYRSLLVKKINAMLNEDAEVRCRRFTGAETIRFEQIYEGRQPQNKYRIRVRTRPAAIFEAFVEKLGKQAILRVVQRIDAAGHDSPSSSNKCVRNPRNGPLCNCRQT